MATPIHPQRPEIERQQTAALLALLRRITATNPFQIAKLGKTKLPETIPDLRAYVRELPFTTKAELSADQTAHPPYGTNLTESLASYTRCHQTSGTSGKPLRWLDTPESWDWMIANWQTIYRAAGITRDDSLYFAFSFGPFIGFWLAFEAAVRMGARCLPGGGMSTAARVRAIIETASPPSAALPPTPNTLPTPPPPKDSISATPVSAPSLLPANPVAPFPQS